MPRKGAKLSKEAQAKQTEAIRAWHKENTVAITFRVRKEKQPRYKELAARRGMSLSGMIQAYLDGECEKEGIE